MTTTLFSFLVKKLKNMLNYYDIAFEVVAVTKKHISSSIWTLTGTDPVVLVKLKRDRNKDEFMRETRRTTFSNRT